MTQDNDAPWQSLMGQDLVLKVRLCVQQANEGKRPPFCSRKNAHRCSTIRQTLQAAPAGAAEVSAKDVVQIRFTGRAADTRDVSDGPVFYRADNPWWLQVGAGDVLPALEMAVRFMSVGETAVVWSHSKYAYGLAGREYRENKTSEMYELPPEANVAYHVTIVAKVDDMEQPAQILQLATARKAQANDMYAAEWSKGAGKERIQRAYARIAKDMETLLSSAADQLSDEDRTTATALRIDALNNTAAVLLRAREFHAAKAAAVAVLELDPQNFKGLIRAAKAALMDPSSDFQEVELALAAAAANADADNVRDDMQALTQAFVQRKKAYEQASKQMYQKAFESKSTDSGQKESKTAAETVTQTSQPTVAAPAPSGKLSPSERNAELRRWFWKYLLPYGFQILVMLSMILYLTYYKPSESIGDSPMMMTATQFARQTAEAAAAKRRQATGDEF